MLYHVIDIEVPPAKVNSALEGLAPALSRGNGTLRACWYAEIGRLNRVLAIREYASADRLAEDERESLTSRDPFGVAGVATAVTCDTYTTFPGVPFLPQGKLGPIFEVRTYRLKRDGLAATFAAWDKVREARAKLSPLTVMYATSGQVPRFMHIWPYATLNDRMAIRDAAVKQGIWPPPGGLAHIETMQSEIFLPAAFSPVQ